MTDKKAYIHTENIVYPFVIVEKKKLLVHNL